MVSLILKTAPCLCLLACLTGTAPALADELPQPPEVLTSGRLPDSTFKTFPVAPLTKGRVIWLNLPLLEKEGFDISYGHTQELEQQVMARYGWVSVDDLVDADLIGEKRGVAFADFYGGGGLEDNIGSARAGSFGRVQVKGIGKTPMLKSHDPSHTARSTVYEGMKDAIWGEVTSRELPAKGNRLLALIERWPSALEGGDAEVLEVRELPLRLANYLPRKDSSNRADLKRAREALKLLPDALPPPAGKDQNWANLPREEKIRLGLQEFVERVGRQRGHMYAWGIDHGTNSQSNIELSGRILDFVTATAQPGHAPISLLPDVEPFGLNHEQTKAAMIDNALKGMRLASADMARALKKVFPEGAERYLRAAFENSYRRELRRQVLERLGIPSHLIDSLVDKHGSALDELAGRTKLRTNRAVYINGINIDALPGSPLAKVIEKIHKAEDWNPRTLGRLGLRKRRELSALLLDAAGRDPAVSLENFRKASALKAEFVARPQRYLYFEDFRSLSATVDSNHHNGVTNAVKDTIASVLTDSQRNVAGLEPYEVPVGMREMSEGFQKELTTYNAREGKWNKIYFLDPAYGTVKLAERLQLPESASLVKVGEANAVRVAVAGADTPVSIAISALGEMIQPARVSFLERHKTRCGTLFAGLQGGEKRPFVYANGVMITGSDLYPVPVVLKNLGLDEAAVAGLKGKKVLSVGEGYSGLLPYLRSKGVEAKGLDLWYGEKEFPQHATGRAMEKYRGENSGHLIPGSALHMPVANGSYDEVVSHMLVNNLPEEQNLGYFREALRAVKLNGKVVTGGLEDWQLQRFKKLLREEHGDKIRIESRPTEAAWVVEDEGLYQASQLLTITRVK